MVERKISVITATYNAAEHISVLISSLERQTDKNFEWIVADGGSTDSTVEKIEAIKDVKVTISSQSDFGIYDAINRAILISKADYYVVIGADDFFYPNAVEVFNTEISNNNYDIITAKYKFGKVVRDVRKGGSLLNKQFAYIAGHSVSTAFKKELHKYVGLYSRAYPIAADQEFVLSAIKYGAKVKRVDEVVGCLGATGVSSTDVLGSLTESLRVQIKHEVKFLAFCVFILKVIKNYRRIK